MEKYEVTINGKTKFFSVDDIFSLCKKHDLKMGYEIFLGRATVDGNTEKASSLLCILRASPELEAAVMVRLSEGSKELRYILEERAAIMAEHKKEPMKILEAILCNIQLSPV